MSRLSDTYPAFTLHGMQVRYGHDILQLSYTNDWVILPAQTRDIV